MHISNDAAPDLLLFLCIEATTAACDTPAGAGRNLADYHQRGPTLRQLAEALAFIGVGQALQRTIRAARGEYHAIRQMLGAQTQRGEEWRGRNNGGGSNRCMCSRSVVAGGVTREPAIYSFPEANVA